MSDLISRQAAIDLFPNDALEWDTSGGYIAPHFARRMIEELPSAQPVRHGKWILEQEEYDGYGYGNWNRWRCSCCGYVRTKGWATTSEGHKPKAMLCEKCGAKMDEERKEEFDCNDCYYSMQNCKDISICCEDEIALCDNFEPVAEKEEI